MARWFLLGTLLLALGLLLILAPSDTTAVRTRKTGAKLFGGNDGYQELNEADEDDDEYTAEDQASPDEDCEDGSCEEAALPDKRRGRRVVRKAGPRGGRQQARRKMGHRMYLGEDDMKLKDSPGSWHWYLLWGSLLMGTLAVTGGGASYAYLVMKSQFLDKLKPGLMNVEKEEKGTELKYALLQHDFRNNPIRCFNWCQTKRLLRSVCPKCPTELVAKNAQLGGNIKCGSCGFVTHAFRGTWFEDLNCAPWQALSVMYHFANGDSIHKAAKKLKLSPEVANHWYDKCQVIAQAHLRVCTPKDVGKRRAKFDDPQEEYDAAHYVDHKYQTCPRFMVGGYGKVVEVDLVPVDKIFDGEWGLLILEKDTWRCYVLSINDPSMDYITRSLKGRVRENTKVYCNFVEAGVPNPSAKNAKGAAPFDVNDDGDLVPDVEGRRKKLVNTELLLKHVLEYTQGEKIEDPDELQTALVQFMWIRAFTNEDKASDVEPFMTFVNQVAKFFKVEGDSKTSPAKKMMYTIDRNARAVDSDAEKEISDADDYLDDFGGKSPFDSGIPSPIPAL